MLILLVTVLFIFQGGEALAEQTDSQVEDASADYDYQNPYDAYRVLRKMVGKDTDSERAHCIMVASTIGAAVSGLSFKEIDKMIADEKRDFKSRSRAMEKALSEKHLKERKELIERSRKQGKNKTKAQILENQELKQALRKKHIKEYADFEKRIDDLKKKYHTNVDTLHAEQDRRRFNTQLEREQRIHDKSTQEMKRKMKKLKFKSFTNGLTARETRQLEELRERSLNNIRQDSVRLKHLRKFSEEGSRLLRSVPFIGPAAIAGFFLADAYNNGAQAAVKNMLEEAIGVQKLADQTLGPRILGDKKEFAKFLNEPEGDSFRMIRSSPQMRESLPKLLRNVHDFNREAKKKGFSCF